LGKLRGKHMINNIGTRRAMLGSGFNQKRNGRPQY
jgi:hypothetical protein